MCTHTRTLCNGEPSQPSAAMSCREQASPTLPQFGTAASSLLCSTQSRTVECCVATSYRREGTQVEASMVLSNLINLHRFQELKLF